MLLAATESISTGDRLSANYHFGLVSGAQCATGKRMGLNP
jgi:hypothetical protein